MPFQLSTQPFGPLPTGDAPLTEYVLEHIETGEFIAILPEYGGVLRRLVLRKGKDLFTLLKTPDSPQALLADESYASALLYPFPSRIRHGVYHFEGQDYALPMNEGSRYNALHGFVHGQAFTVIGEETAPTYAQLTLRCEYDGNLPGYPFPFELTVTYQLIQADQLPYGGNPATDRMCALHISYEARNTGFSRCPAAFGWHPYFMVSEEAIDDMTLTLPERTPIVLDGDMIPNGRLPVEPGDAIALTDRQFDTPFAVEPTGRSATGISYVETVLTSQKTGVRLTMGQQTGEGKLNYLVCYTPPRRDSIALEPLTANVNSFNTGDGLTILNPGETLSGTMWVRLD